MGKIESVNETYTMAGVSIVGSNAVVTLPNKTNQILEVGDYVWVHYWQSITDGYIAVKNGQGDYMLNIGDGSTNSAISIDNAFLLREKNYETVTTHSYDPNDEYDTTDFYNVTVNSITRSTYFPDVYDLYDFYSGGEPVDARACYLYKMDCTMSNGGQITLNWIPNYHWGHPTDQYGNIVPVSPEYVASGSYSTSHTIQIECIAVSSLSRELIIETHSFYLTTDDDGVNYRLWLVRTATPNTAEARRLVAYKPIHPHIGETDDPYDVGSFNLMLALDGAASSFCIGDYLYRLSDKLMMTRVRVVALELKNGYWQPSLQWHWKM